MALTGTPAGRPGAWRWQFSMALALALVGVLVAGVVLVASAAESNRLGVDTLSSTGSGRAVFGVVHTQADADPWYPTQSVGRAKAVLGVAAPLQAQAIMGWGVDNPEPANGVFSWSTLDRRMALIKSTGATPVIDLCCSPDWMAGGASGSTNWKRFGTAPTPQNYESYARLAVAVAKRYPYVHYFEVWSEFKGFYDPSRNNWNIAAYTKLYNDVYRALKHYNPALKVGGPYAPMVSWRAPSAGGFPSSLSGAWGVMDRRSLNTVRYWLKHKAGAQFLAVDGSSATRDAPSPANPVTALQKFAATNHWLRARTTLPIWWSETYVGLPSGVAVTSQEAAALYAAAAMQLENSGAARVMFWDPEQYSASTTPGIFTSVQTPSGGSVTTFGRLLEALNAVTSVQGSTLTRSAGSWRLTSRRGTLVENLTNHPLRTATGVLASWRSLLTLSRK